MEEEVTKVSQRASVTKSQQDETLAQLSSLEESYRQRDEARTQRDGALARAAILR